MSRESEKIFDGITGVGEDLIEAAQEPVKKRRVWLKWCAAAAALMLVAGGLFAMLRGGQSSGNDALKPYRIAAAVYPENASYPDEADYINADGEFRDEEWMDAYSVWSEDQKARWQYASVYGEALDGFLAESIPRFLADAKGENKVYSPLNVYMALAMLAETTDGESHAQILNLLGVNDSKTLREQASAVWNAHYNDDGASASVLASSLWLSEDSRFVQETIDRLAKTYYASSYRGKMGSEEMNRALQAWLNENTGGLLQEQADNLELDAETDMALATTVYFSAKWINEFQPDRNTTGVFHAADGDRDSTFMHQDHSRAYYWGEKFSAVSQELETCNGGTMWFLLPDEGVTPEELLNDEEAMGFLLTNPARWQPGKNRPLWEKQKALIVHFSLPKFDVMSQTDLVEGLKALGVTDVFDPFAADFTPMTGFKDGGYLSKVDHAVRVAVDEEGVVAAAYTVMQRAGSAMPPDEEVDFTLDRPFVFAIKTTDDLPLFVGIVNHP